MFKAIEKLSGWLANKLCQSEENNDNFDYYEYSLQGICYFTLYTTISIFIGIAFGYIIYLPIIILTILYVREQAGGYHHTKTLYCMLNTCGFYFLEGIMSLRFKEYFIVFFFISLYSFSKLEDIPKYAPEQIQHNQSKQDFIRINYIVRLFVMTILNIFCIFMHYEYTSYGVFEFSVISTILSMSLIINRFCVSDIAFKLVEKLP